MFTAFIKPKTEGGNTTNGVSISKYVFDIKFRIFYSPFICFAFWKVLSSHRQTPHKLLKKIKFASNKLPCYNIKFYVYCVLSHILENIIPYVRHIGMLAFHILRILFKQPKIVILFIELSAYTNVFFQRLLQFLTRV